MLFIQSAVWNRIAPSSTSDRLSALYLPNGLLKSFSRMGGQVVSAAWLSMVCSLFFAFLLTFHIPHTHTHTPPPPPHTHTRKHDITICRVIPIDIDTVLTLALRLVTFKHMVHVHHAVV